MDLETFPVSLFVLVDDWICDVRPHEARRSGRPPLPLGSDVLNSIYLDESVRRLREEEAEVREEDLAQVSPPSRAHVNVLGRYSFDLYDSPAGGGTRPLRDPSKNEEDEPLPLLSGEPSRCRTILLHCYPRPIIAALRDIH